MASFDRSRATCQPSTSCLLLVRQRFSHDAACASCVRLPRMLLAPQPAAGCFGRRGACERPRRVSALAWTAASAAHTPASRTPRFFVNLTNGIGAPRPYSSRRPASRRADPRRRRAEAVPALQAAQLPYSFVRLQSSLCESQALEKLCLELDANLLTSLALGYDCFVVDYASRNKTRAVPRALWCGARARRRGRARASRLAADGAAGTAWSSSPSRWTACGWARRCGRPSCAATTAAPTSRTSCTTSTKPRASGCVTPHALRRRPTACGCGCDPAPAVGRLQSLTRLRRRAGAVRVHAARP